MKNNYLQEEQKTINKINRNFLENTIVMAIYLLLFRRLNGKFSNEQSFFMHLTGDKNFISRLLFAFSLTVLCAILLSIVIYLVKRFFLRKYRHIKSNLFFLNDGWVIALNCLLKICGYTMLVMSFMSLQRLLLTFTFISLCNLLEERRDPELQLSPGFFSWKDMKLQRLFVFLLLLAISFPIYDATMATQFIRRLKNNISEATFKAKEDFSLETREIIIKTFSSVPFSSLVLSGYEVLGKILSSKETKGGLFVIVLLSFARDAIDQSMLSFGNFWKEVAATTKRVEWFKLFSNFQSAARNKKARSFAEGINGFPVLCYESFALNPNFVKQSYIEKIDNFDREFVKKIESISELIKLVNNQVGNAKERSFILYWVFNHIKSFQDFLSYNESINRLNSTAYSKDTAT